MYKTLIICFSIKVCINSELTLSEVFYFLGQKKKSHLSLLNINKLTT